MPDQLVILERKDPHIAVVRLNRAEKKNSMSQDLDAALRDAWAEVKEDDDIWTVILTGSGDAFCAGGDLKENIARARGELKPAREPKGIMGREGYSDLYNQGMNKPLIGAINGYAVGGGFHLALNTDIRYCVPAARFGCSEVRWSHMAAWPSYMMTLPLGWGMWFALTGQMIDADTAFRIGLVQKVCEPDKLMDDCLDLAETINRNGKLIGRHTKEYVQRSLHDVFGWQAAYDLHGLYYYHLRQSKDYDEGSAAFSEKRRPQFSGEYYQAGEKPPGVGT